MSQLFTVEPEADERPDLPPLTGSEKQVRWAQHIRAEKLREVAQHLREWEALIARYRQTGKDPHKVGQAQDEYHRAVVAAGRLEEKTAANWWIPRRENTARELLNGADPRPGDSWSHRDGAPR